MKEKNTFNKVIAFKDKTNFLKILKGDETGKKTELLFNIKKYFDSKEKKTLYINFKEVENEDMLKGMYFYEHIEKYAKNLDERLYLFLDEVQELEDWQKITNAFRLTIDADVYIAGSSLDLLEVHDNTYIAGRYVGFDAKSNDFTNEDDDRTL